MATVADDRGGCGGPCQPSPHKQPPQALPSVGHVDRNHLLSRRQDRHPAAARSRQAAAEGGAAAGLDVAIQMRGHPAADDPSVHATFGAFSFEGVRRDREPSRMRAEAFHGRRRPRRLRLRCAVSRQSCLSRATMKFMATDASTESSTLRGGSSEALRNAAERRGTPPSAEWDGTRMAGNLMYIRAESVGRKSGRVAASPERDAQAAVWHLRRQLQSAKLSAFGNWDPGRAEVVVAGVRYGRRSPPRLAPPISAHAGACGAPRCPRRGRGSAGCGGCDAGNDRRREFAGTVVHHRV